MKIKAIMYSTLRRNRPQATVRPPAPPVVVKPRKQIVVRHLGLATGQIVIVHRRGIPRKIYIKHIEG